MKKPKKNIGVGLRSYIQKLKNTGRYKANNNRTSLYQVFGFRNIKKTKKDKPKKRGKVRY